MESSRGIWTSTADVDLLLRLAGSGFDWLALDAQHGPVDRAALHVLGRALASVPTPFLVRVPAVDAAWIGAALDAGAAGVVVPSVTSAADAERAALAARYPPLGERSWGPFAPLWGGVAQDPEAANELVRCWVMVETPGALDDVEAIAATPGVDGLFVGPLDLALSLGTTVEALLDDDDPDGPLARVVAAAGRQGLLVGAFAGSPAAARRLRAHGIGFLAVTSDAAVLAAGVRAVLAEDTDPDPA
ncbi:HpcH/HpaI aldolase family protein [Phycicoccus sonneratiae]|uniref:2,4-dihydroxyhept-2-ene-1,7-dioic acid aldolase n=1 Tax=Phycicoccus sonneratiae TaxID=2807628 RepID=A0ABS2CRF8_9MICO|nr:aldolase/citrate lyase family protein [Phycicoccus sonneraticus]MBM6402370.1 2,4-dihydroxyhept-2-ene-1,7-dioic acid aldolase [Phycicoccus sonneraticus]